MSKVDWKKEMPLFKEKTDAFYNGELKANEYKGFSGLYGSYAQKGGQASMLRLRMSAGRLTKEKLNYVVSKAKEYQVDPIHFTTCQAIQFHNLNKEAVYDIMENAIDHDIITFGGGGDFPRNVMCSPLSGVDKNEHFDVMPYALKAADYLLGFVYEEKMPRKLKVCFSSNETNWPHATFRDLGFVANSNNKFDVYSAGGLGNNPKLGVKVAENIEKEDILYYIKAMRLTFLQYGNYENRAKARTRYMQEVLGVEGYKKAFLENLEKVKGEDLKIKVEPINITKIGNGKYESKYAKEQKQEGLYSVLYHPIGGKPSLSVLEKINTKIKDMDQVELRITPNEEVYIINLNALEAKQIEEIVQEDNYKTLFDLSVSCIGSTICQVGLRDSQGLLNKCVRAVREANIRDGALPRIRISGCPSSCAAHQTNILSFRGNTKIIDKKPYSAFSLFVGGNDLEGKEVISNEVGIILEDKIPEFLVELGHEVEKSNKDYYSWYQDDPNKVIEIAKKYF